MSEYTTVARPYAKAVFDLALEQQNLLHWQAMLTFAAQVSSQEEMSVLLLSALSSERLAEKFNAICSDVLDEQGRNLISLMAENKRLSALPEVLQQFIQLCEDQQGIIDVSVISAAKLSKQQQAKITIAMERSLARKVKLNCSIDGSVMAGLIIRAGDMVIDGSIRGRLERLTDFLQS